MVIIFWKNVGKNCHPILIFFPITIFLIISVWKILFRLLQVVRIPFYRIVYKGCSRLISIRHKLTYSFDPSESTFASRGRRIKMLLWIMFVNCLVYRKSLIMPRTLFPSWRGGFRRGGSVKGIPIIFGWSSSRSPIYGDFHPSVYSDNASALGVLQTPVQLSLLFCSGIDLTFVQDSAFSGYGFNNFLERG